MNGILGIEQYLIRDWGRQVMAYSSLVCTAWLIQAALLSKPVNCLVTVHFSSTYTLIVVSVGIYATVA